MDVSDFLEKAKRIHGDRYEYPNIVTKNDIKINNASEGLKYEINTDDISIEVTGKENELIGLDITDFTIIVDVTDLEAGEHQVKLNVSSTKEFAAIKLSTETVNIIIK